MKNLFWRQTATGLTFAQEAIMVDGFAKTPRYGLKAVFYPTYPSVLQASTVEAGIKCTWGRFDEADLAMIRGDRASLTRVLAQRHACEDLIAQQKLDAFIDRPPSTKRTQAELAWFSRQLQR